MYLLLTLGTGLDQQINNTADILRWDPAAKCYGVLKTRNVRRVVASPVGSCRRVCVCRRPSSVVRRPSCHRPPRHAVARCVASHSRSSRRAVAIRAVTLISWQWARRDGRWHGATPRQDYGVLKIQNVRRVACRDLPSRRVVTRRVTYFSIDLGTGCVCRRMSCRAVPCHHPSCRAVAHCLEINVHELQRHDATDDGTYGTTARRHDGTTARRHDGTTARRHDGTTARRDTQNCIN